MGPINPLKHQHQNRLMAGKGWVVYFLKKKKLATVKQGENFSSVTLKISPITMVRIITFPLQVGDSRRCIFQEEEAL